MTELYMALAGILGTAATGFVGWFFGRKKTQAEVVSAQIDNDIKLSSHYQAMLDDLKPRYQMKLKDFEETANSKIKLYEEENKFLKQKVRILQQENRTLRADFKKLKLEHQNLVSAYGNSTK